jgi:hypothetical protein
MGGASSDWLGTWKDASIAAHQAIAASGAISSSTVDNSRRLNIDGGITINTNATDGAGLAEDFHRTLNDNALASWGNSGGW